MVDIAPELYERLHSDFADRVENSPKLAALRAKQDPTYKDAQEFAETVGDMLQRTFKECISADELPNGMLYFNIAERTVRPMLVEAYDLIADFTQTVQESLNKRAGLGIKAITPDIDEDRIKGLIERLSDGE